jgi:hypothetical protein
MSIKNVLNAMDIASVITETIDSATSYLKDREREITERQRLQSCLNAITAKIQMERGKFETYINKSFDERERLYKTMDLLIAKGMEENDIELIKHASNVMLNVYNKNPLDGFTESKEVKLEGLQPMRTYID